MTTQVNLDLIWADTPGASIDPGAAKYVLGWVSEIPSYQNFNYVLGNTTTNLLVLAEAGQFDWLGTISYLAGTRAKIGGNSYYAIADNVNLNPTLGNEATWSLGAAFGDTTTYVNEQGLLIKNVNARTAGSWTGSDVTISNTNAFVQLDVEDVNSNMVVGNSAGEFVVVDTGSVTVPDGRSIVPGAAGVNRVFHEGHPPVQAEVAGTVEEAANSGKAFARVNSSWVDMVNLIYPVGSIIESTDLINPSVRFQGTTWVAHGTGRVTVAIDTGKAMFDTVGKFSGQLNATLVSHNHTLVDSGIHSHAQGYASEINRPPTYGTGALGPYRSQMYTDKRSGAPLTSTEGGHAHIVNLAGTSKIDKNVQPSIAVYRWERTA